MISKTR